MHLHECTTVQLNVQEEEKKKEKEDYRPTVVVIRVNRRERKAGHVAINIHFKI